MKKLLTVAVLLVALVIATLVAPAQGASAATCTSLSRYTTYYNNKPTLYIWGIPGSGTDSRGIGIYYYDEFGGWIQVPASSEWGIQMIPQVRKDQWTGYYIATRWYIFHPRWDDDWRWYVQICR